MRGRLLIQLARQCVVPELPWRVPSQSGHGLGACVCSDGLVQSVHRSCSPKMAEEVRNHTSRLWSVAVRPLRR